jgi:signal transduction histidine kinase
MSALLDDPSHDGTSLTADLASDIAVVQSIDAVPRILDAVCRMTGMGFAAVARVTEDRWICCASLDYLKFGLQPGGELEVKSTICDEIRDSRQPVVIDNVAEDGLYCAHHTPRQYGLQSYISMPIILRDGSFFGTLCAIDPKPAKLSDTGIVETFRLFAELIATHIDAVDRLNKSEATLLDERKTAELREQFIAVLGHDLRNPLASIAAGVRLLPTAKSKEAEILGMMHQSVVRMTSLIDNIMDFARGRLGSGIILNRTTQPIEPVINQVVDELISIHPGRKIETNLQLNGEVYCDGSRIGQLVSNLLANALTHGSPERPIFVEATTRAGEFELSISNSGRAIAPEAMDKLFQPFYRGEVRSSLQGLGLGLFISSEIAKAHGGTLTVDSNDEETTFTFRMPLPNDRDAVKT